MSSGEGLMDEMLLVWMSFLWMKAFPFTRTTLVREGMSVYEGRVIGKTFQRDDARIVECVTAIGSGEGNEFRQVYSSLRLYITTAHDQFRRVFITEHECIFTQLYGGQFWQI